MEWLMLVCALEVGLTRGSDVGFSTYVEMDSTVVVASHLYVGGTLKSYQVTDDTQFWPFRMDYTLRGGVMVGHVTVGVEHLCYHPVVPFDKDRFSDSNGGIEKVFIRVTTR